MDGQVLYRDSYHLSSKAPENWDLYSSRFVNYGEKMTEAQRRTSQVLPDVMLVGDFPFPTGSAASNNLQGHCRAIREAGFSVGVLRKSVPTPSAVAEQNELSSSYRGTPYWAVPTKSSSSKLQGFFREHLATRNPQLEWLARTRLEGVKAVLAYTGVVGSTPYLFRLRRLCRVHGVRLFGFVVEWHHPGHFKGAGATLKAIDSELQRRCANRFLDGVICITRTLQDYYKQRGKKAYLVPPLLDLSDPKWKTAPQDACETSFRPLRLLFSGTCARDRHDLMLSAVHALRQQGASIVVEYLGSSRKQVAEALGESNSLLEALGGAVRFHGRVPDDQVHKITRSASFAIMLRDNAHWARCCFPSRISECSALGVPMLCNLTGDLASYLRSPDNAIPVPSVTVEGFSQALQRALALNKAQFRAMKTGAKKLAERFDGSRYANLYKEVLA